LFPWNLRTTTCRTVSGFIVVMLWIYLVTLSILLGAQADAALIASREVTP
jgi:uncharacterized BrkB/YihY/UPF0761 family membrane protein